MYSYITKELPDALASSFKELDFNNVSITGHSMGGHGALTLARITAKPIKGPAADFPSISS
jgi:S-formylglutathione hydrolase FrmB